MNDILSAKKKLFRGCTVENIALAAGGLRPGGVIPGVFKGTMSGVKEEIRGCMTPSDFLNVIQFLGNNNTLAGR